MDKQLNEGKLQNEVNKNEEVMSNFDEFKSFLQGKVEMGEKIGMGEEQLANAAEKVAGFLAEKQSPKNSEERLLQELWKVGTEDERHKLAHMLVKFVQ